MVSIKVLNLASGERKDFAAVGANEENEDEEEATNNLNRNEGKGRRAKLSQAMREKLEQTVVVGKIQENNFFFLPSAFHQ